MPKPAEPTMDAEQLEQWEAEVRAGHYKGRRGAEHIGSVYLPMWMLCQQCDRLFVWGAETQRHYFNKARMSGKQGPPTCGIVCARKQGSRGGMNGALTPRYQPLHVIADLAYARAEHITSAR